MSSRSEERRFGLRAAEAGIVAVGAAVVALLIRQDNLKKRLKRVERRQHRQREMRKLEQEVDG